LPTVAVDPVRFQTPPPTGLRVTWLGHAALLVEIDGVRVLTDPVWGQRASPFGWVGPQRWYTPPIALGELPRERCDSEPLASLDASNADGFGVAAGDRLLVLTRTVEVALNLGRLGEPS
jgi:hypothetical protein